MLRQIIVTILMAFFSSLSLAATFHVDVRNTSGQTDGTANRPYIAISEAIVAASSGSTILVAGGEYRENLVIQDVSLTLKGGYLGGSTLQYTNGAAGDFSSRDTGSNTTHIKGDGSTATVLLMNAGTTLFDGFRVTGGSGYNDSYTTLGGGCLLMVGVLSSQIT